MDAAAVIAAIASLGGIASTRQLADAGVPTRALSAAQAIGAVNRVRRGWYATPRAPRPIVAAVRAGGRLACCSALRLAGAWVVDDGRLHVTVGAGGHAPPPPPGVTLHWAGAGLSDSYPMASLAEALGQFVKCGPEAAVVAAADSLLHLRLASENEVLGVLAASTRGRRVTSLLDPSSESGLESLVRVALRRRRVRLRTQVFIQGVGRVDLLVGDRLVVELDGEQWHGGDRFEEDRRRDLALVAAGYLVVRISYRQVMNEWDAIERLLLEIIRRRDHRWRGELRRSGWPSGSR